MASALGLTPSMTSMARAADEAAVSNSIEWGDYLRQYDLMVSLNPSYADVKASVVRWFEDALVNDQDGVVVDVGCGTGQLILALAPRFPHTRFVGVDADQGCLDLLAEKAAHLPNVEVQCADARSWEVRGSLKVCSFMHSLYTLGPADAEDGPRAALAHAHARLQRGGRLILTDIQRQLRYRRWALYVFVSAVRRHGLPKALSIFATNSSARHANINIEREQRAGRMLLATLAECIEMVRSAGFADIIHAREDLYAPGWFGGPIDNQVVAIA